MAKIREVVRLEHPEVEELFQKLKQKFIEKNPGEDTKDLESAFEMATSAHRNQFRESGEPYILHPLEVALICVDLNMDKESVISALLHDTVEDTPIRLVKIRNLFGERVAEKVDALTKIKRIDLFARFTGRTMSDEQARNLQKLFLAMARDFSVLVIKIADRLHNLRTMENLPPEHVRRKAMETLDYYVPLARRLGLQELAVEMEVLCFKYLYPKEYEWVKQELAQYFMARRPVYEKMVQNLERALKENGIDVISCFGREKSPYSTWKKMSTQRVPLDQIFDLIAIRIIIRGDELDCYKALGIVHSLYRPLFNRFRDYIAAPKSNGYQSLHTTVAGEGGQIVEVQIRTEWMEEVAEHGVAAHWKYKGSAEQARLRETFSWFKFIEDLSEDVTSSEEFVEKTRESLSKEEVLVLTPQGEVVSLPAGSTPLDFAYFIHTDLGHSFGSARVNGALVPLDYELNTGDVIEIIKNESGKPDPKPEWLTIAKSPKSILKIKRWFRKRPRKERVELGKLLLRLQIEREGLYPLNLMDNAKLLELVKVLGTRKIDDLFDEIASGRLQVNEVVQKLKTLYIEKLAKQEKSASVEVAHGFRVRPLFQAPVGIASEFGVLLQGGKPLRRKVELMNCCTPIWGDPIIGIDNRTKHRVEIHHSDCPNSATIPKETLIAVQWQESQPSLYYPTSLYIMGLNRVGLLFDILGKLSKMGVNLMGGNLNLKPSIVHEDEIAEFELVVELRGVDQLNRVISSIKQVKDVISVRRFFRSKESLGTESSSTG